MTAAAPPRSGFAEVDRLIVGALRVLRAARAVAESAPTAENLERLTPAEAHLNALLEYRHARLH